MIQRKECIAKSGKSDAGGVSWVHGPDFGHEPPVNGRWIRLRLFDPEERPFAITKSPQIRMITFALVG